MDESGFDPRMCRKFSRAVRGKKARANVKGKREKRINVIAALILGKICAFFPSSENTDTDLFTAWVKIMLIPFLKSGMVVIMDNAKFHKSKEIRKLIEGAGCRLIYLPPYSPDFNKIEQRWAVIKTEVKRIKDSFQSFGTAVRTAVQKYA